MVFATNAEGNWKLVPNSVVFPRRAQCIIDMLTIPLFKGFHCSYASVLLLKPFCWLSPITCVIKRVLHCQSNKSLKCWLSPPTNQRTSGSNWTYYGCWSGKVRKRNRALANIHAGSQKKGLATASLGGYQYKQMSLIFQIMQNSLELCFLAKKKKVCCLLQGPEKEVNCVHSN